MFLQSGHHSAGFQVTFGAGGGTWFQICPAVGGGRGGEEEGGEHAKVYHCIMWKLCK